MRVLVYVAPFLMVVAVSLAVTGCTQFLADIQKSGMHQDPESVDYNFGGEK